MEVQWNILSSILILQFAFLWNKNIVIYKLAA